MGDLFQAELLALDQMEKKRIQVWINSPGGSVMDGYNMYNAMLKTKTKVDTYCVGIALQWLQFFSRQEENGSWQTTEC
jgi:ATP-dependent protease ClpP protease subunit